MKTYYLIFLCFYISIHTTVAQNLPSFKHYSIRGLAPKSIITSIYQDKEGFLWFGGLSGLYKYDGNMLTRFQHNAGDSSSLPHNYIVDFCEDSIGEFVCASLGGGVFIVNKTNGKCTRPVASEEVSELKSNGIFRIVYKSSLTNQIFCGSSLGNLSTYDVKTKHLEHIFSLSTYYKANDKTAISGMLETKPRKFLVATFHGLYYLEPGSKKSFPISSLNSKLGLFDSIEIHSLLKDNANRIWIGYKSGVMIIDAQTFDPIISLSKSLNTTLNQYTVNAITQLKDGQVLLGTNNGIFCWDELNQQLKSTVMNENSSENIKHINHFHTDLSGNTWVATEGQGLFLLNKNYTFFKTIPGLKQFMNSGKIQAIMEDAQGNRWIGGDNGVLYYKHDMSSFETVPLENTKKMMINSIFEDNQNGIWIGTVQNGLYYLPDAKKKSDHLQFLNVITDNDTTVVNLITAINQDRFNNIWVGTFTNGVFIYNLNTRRFIHYFALDKTGSKAGTAVSQILKDKHGDMWVSTWDNGFYKFISETDDAKKGKFIQYTNIPKDTNSLSFPITSSMLEDKKGNIWIGTVSGGLNKFNEAKKHFTRFSIDNGLPSNLVYRIEEDKKGNIWCSTDEGISMLSAGLNQPLNFREEDGLPTRSFTFLASNKWRDGTIAFGTIDGDVIYFEPENIEENKQAPAIVDFKLFNRSLSSGEENIFFNPVNIADTFYLKHNQSVFTFEFTNFDFINPNNYTFTYKLEGVDKDWNLISNRKSATYTNLSPGQYSFRLKAANHLGVWSSQEVIKWVIVSPPWWQTWWAYASYAILFVGILWAFIYYRSRSLIRDKRRLEQQVSFRTAEVVQQKEEVAIQRDNLEQALYELKSTQAQLIQSEKMASLGELTARIAHEIQNPLNFVNNFSDVNKELLEELKDEADKGNIDEVKAIATDIIANEEKINHHGKRADAIVKGMLQHSRTSSGQKEATDINALCDEYLRLSYHGLRAKDKSFNAELKTEYDNAIEKINIIPQDIGRVLLNLINNAFYAVNEKKKTAGENYQPTVSVTTKKINDKIEISVADNGNGIPASIKEKIFQPFFTTKPTGQGTGLGLSLSYDIIKAHGGEIKVESKEGEGTLLTIQLPVS